MKINKENISKLNPCKDRFDNFVKFYGKKELTKRQFMGLKNISQSDKLWVAFKMMDRKQITLACSDIAQSVLGIYESKYPNDMRVRECIEATKLYANGKITIEELRQKRAAAYAAYAAAYAVDAAAYAAYAAAYAAYAAAAYAAAYAAVDAAADAAAYAAVDDAVDAKKSARNTQEKINRTIILKYWK